MGSPVHARHASEILDAGQVCGHVGAGFHAMLASNRTVIHGRAGSSGSAGGSDVPDVGVHVDGRDRGVLLTVVSSPTCRVADVRRCPESDVEVEDVTSRICRVADVRKRP